MNTWLALGLGAMVIVAGVLYQEYGKLDDRIADQSQTNHNLQQQLDGQTDDLAQYTTLKGQLQSSQSDDSQTHGKVTSLQNQLTDEANQVTARDQLISQDKTQLQQLTLQNQQLAASNYAANNELTDLKTKYAYAESQLQQPITPTVGVNPTLASAYPTHSLVAAKSIEAAALASQQSALSQVKAIYISLQTQYDQSPEYVQAKTDLATANSAYTAARQAVIDNLLSTSTDYQAAIAAKQSAAKTVSDAREAGSSGDDLASLAQKSLDAGTAVTTLETAALAADSNYQDAKTKRDAARSNVNQLNQEFETMLATNRNYQQAKVDYDAATANHNAALANVETLDQQEANELKAQESASLQTDFQSWHQQNQQNNMYPTETQEQRDRNGN